MTERIPKMRSRRTPGSSAYYEVTQQIFDLESRVLTAVLPHAGERGANDEERCRAFLSKVLPRCYSIGTGFIVSADAGSSPSPQQDIVIYDDFFNAPLHRELSAAVFPIETVYGTVEVKGRLQHKDLRSTLRSIGAARQLSIRCHYQRYFQPGQRAGRSADKEMYQVKKPPRAFVFAYDTTFASLDRFKQAWESAIDEVKTAHLHGVVVLKKDWYAFQIPHASRATLKVFKGDALMRFTSGMLDLLRATKIEEAVMERYLKIETPPTEADK
jgi:hypothetical protein